MKSNKEILQESIDSFRMADHLFGETYEAVSKAMDIARMESATEFFKWYIMKGNNFLFYHREIKPLTTSKEIEDKIAEFEGQTLDNLYALFIEEQNKKIEP